ncbi:MAG: nicotinate (nicotinamide) nucleotide adenylyltransferase [Clostridia bacterium]|nr:nicotinate (nicotinamide) nucleotide adenylyltransferase [Clostridia bacterium]
MRKIAIYGGSFNPPHIGHLNAARSFLKHTGAEKLVVIPSFIPPHKECSDFASAEDRLNMCRLNFLGIEEAEISDIEIARGGKSYTYVTLQELSCSECELYFLVGTDMLLTLDKWMHPEIILKCATLCYVRREQDEALTGEIFACIAALEEKYGVKIMKIDADVKEISSTEIREAIRCGTDISSYILPEVFDYIRQNRVYF